MSGRVQLTFVNVTKQRFHFPISQPGSFGGFFSSDHSATSFNFHQAQNNLTLFWKKKIAIKYLPQLQWLLKYY